MADLPIPTFIINLKERYDRKTHITNEFFGRQEFDVHIVEAHKHEYGAIGLWNTIKHIVMNLPNPDEEFILICEDDHQFTEKYCKFHLFESIKSAQKHDAEVLLGGVSWLQSIFSITKSLYWIETFNGAQFTIIFNSLFEKIINAEFNRFNAADFKISILTRNKFLIYPFISVQKDFGYSDATPRNNSIKSVSKLFEEADLAIKYLLLGESFYKSAGNKADIFDGENFVNELFIRTYLVYPESKRNEISTLLDSFESRQEFDVKTFVYEETKSISKIHLKNLKTIIKSSIKDEEDVIIYCDHTHTFSKQYDKTIFLSSILKAHSLGADLLYSSADGVFEHAVPISDHLIWVDQFNCMQFIVIFRSIFNKILTEPFQGGSLGLHLSRLSTNKMIFLPLVSNVNKRSSISKDFQDGQLENSLHLLENRLLMIQADFLRLRDKLNH